MRRITAICASLLLLAGIFSGCTRDAGKPKDGKPIVQVDPPKPQPDGDKPNKDKIDGKKNGGDAKVPNSNPDDEKQERFEATLTDALSALADRRWEDALHAFETARTFNDNEFVKSEIAKLRLRLDQDGAAKQTVKNIESVLNDGKADDAVKLANDALKEFGDSDDAADLIKLRLQADALQTAEKKEDAEVRFQGFRKEGETSLQEKNLRAAALAFELALQAKDDAGVKAKYEEVRGKVDEYDLLRKKASDLRRDATQLEDALDALKQAAAIWDTLAVKSEIDEIQLALQKRRETVSVINFEVRNDVGMGNAGAILADELLPRLKPKYDVVDRDSLNKVLFDLKAPQNFVDDPQQQRQVAKLAKVRYLVAGSVSRLVGVTIRARLIDAQTGLVVQTAKVSANTIQDAIALAPDLAKQLMMTDAEQMQFEAQQQEIKPAVLAPDDAPVPPAPLPPAVNDPAPPPPPMQNAGPPALGNVQQNVFDNFKPAPPTFVPVQINPLEAQRRNRLLFASLEVGDFLFRVGRFGEAQRQFEFALQLAPDNVDIQLRLERVRPFVPVVYVAGPRPRLAVLPFAVFGNPNVVPRSLSYWTQANIAPYFGFYYDVVDPNEVYWYMGRLGLTMRDLMEDPNARRWLGRAVGVRYFVVGTLVQANSFDANTYVLDAETGYLQGSGSIRVRDPFELKLRLQELAALAQMSPAERIAYLAAAEEQRFQKLVFEGRRHMDEGRYRDAVREFERALELRPYNVQVQVWLNNCLNRVRFDDFMISNNKQLAFNIAARNAARNRQLQLAAEAEAARRRAIAEAAARSEADKRVHVDIRLRAQGSLFASAKIALETKRFGVSVSLFQSAVDFAPPPTYGVPVPPPPTLYQEFAQARLGAEKRAEFREAQITAAREETLRKVREQQLADAQRALELEQQKSKEKLDAVRFAQLKRDDEAYRAGIKQGTLYVTQSKYEAALASFQGAQRVAHTPMQQTEVNDLIAIVVQRQAEALAKTADEKAALEKRFAAERERRKGAEALAKQNEEAYKLALQTAQTALTAKNFTTARAKFQEAGKIFQTDAVLTGLKQIETAEAAQAVAAAKVQTDAKKAETIKQLLSSGNAALDAKKFTDAVQAFQQAKKLAPDNLDVIAGLTKAEQGRDRMLADVRAQAEKTDRAQNFARLLKSGQANLASKQFEAAVANLSEALKLNPTDASVQAALKQAEAGRDAALKDAKAIAAAKQRAADYQKLISDGRLAMNSKRFGDAITAFNAAQKLLPGDKASQDYLLEAQTAKKNAEDAIAVAAKQRAAELKRAADLKDALTAGRGALAANNLVGANKALAQAKALSPTDAEVLRLQTDIQQAQQKRDAAAAAQKQRLVDFTAQLNAGKAALAAKRYPEALKALQAATTLMPENGEAQKLFRDAQQAALGDKQRQADYQTALNAGQKALQTKNYVAAIASFQQALKIMPNDTSALKLLQQAQNEQNLATKTDASFKAAMAAGEKAMLAKDFTTAIKSFTEATKLHANDTLARQRLAAAQQAFNDANAAAAALANYTKAMKAGDAAMNGKKFNDAIKSYSDALKFIPSDANATQALARARQALADSMKVKPPLPDPAKQFADAMQRGADAEKDKKYAEAVKAYQEALKLRPKDANAQAGLNNNQFSLHLWQGQQYLDNSMWVAAQNEFESALRLFPKNAQAQKLLEKAKKKMK